MDTLSAVDALLRAVATVGLEQRAELDRLDAVTGDGDFGSTLARGASALALDPPGDDDAPGRLRTASRALTAAMGGTSGPLLGVAALRAAVVLEEAGALDAAVAGRMAHAAATGIGEYGGAVAGDKTLLDVLVPLADALAEEEGFAVAAGAARAAADATAGLEARAGRSSYSGERSRGEPDAGAVGVALVAEALAAGDPSSWEALAARADDSVGGGEDGEGPADAPTGFVGRPSRLVDDAITGFVAANAGIVRWLEGERVVLRTDADPAHVAVVSGGGAGHEPLHAGFVGAGMLSAACPGSVFTSPSVDQVLAAVRAVATDAGVLLVVKQYTGDVLNFRLASELAAAEGIRTETVVVADDVALPVDTPAGRRGTGLTIVVEKVAGALAATGAPLEEVAAVARRVGERGRSFGVALHGAEMELGVGIHGEPGRDREPIVRLDRMAALLADPPLEELGPERGDRLLVVLSGLGGTPALELQALHGAVTHHLAGRGLAVARALVGDLITSLAQAGAVLTLAVLDDELCDLWDAPVHTAALRW